MREEILLLHHHHYYQHHHKLSLCCLSIFTMTKTPVLLSCTENTKNFTNFYWTEKSLDNFTIFFLKFFLRKYLTQIHHRIHRRYILGYSRPFFSPIKYLWIFCPFFSFFCYSYPSEKKKLLLILPMRTKNSIIFVNNKPTIFDSRFKERPKNHHPFLCFWMRRLNKKNSCQKIKKRKKIKNCAKMREDVIVKDATKWDTYNY